MQSSALRVPWRAGESRSQELRVDQLADKLDQRERTEEKSGCAHDL